MRKSARSTSSEPTPINPVSSQITPATNQKPMPSLPVKPKSMNKPSLPPATAKRKFSKSSSQAPPAIVSYDIASGTASTSSTVGMCDSSSVASDNSNEDAVYACDNEIKTGVSSNQKVVDARRTIAGALAKQVLSSRIHKDVGAIPSQTSEKVGDENEFPIDKNSSPSQNTSAHVTKPTAPYHTTNIDDVCLTPSVNHDSTEIISESTLLDVPSPHRVSPPAPIQYSPAESKPPPPAMPSRPPAMSPRPPLPKSREATLKPSRPAPQPSRTTWYMRYDEHSSCYSDLKRINVLRKSSGTAVQGESLSVPAESTREVVHARKAVKYAAVYGESQGGGVLGTRNIRSGEGDGRDGCTPSAEHADVTSRITSSTPSIVSSTATSDTSSTSTSVSETTAPTILNSKPKPAPKPFRRKSSKLKKASSIFYAPDPVTMYETSTNVASEAIVSQSTSPSLSINEHIHHAPPVHRLSRASVDEHTPSVSPSYTPSQGFSHNTSPPISHSTSHTSTNTVTVNNEFSDRNRLIFNYPTWIYI